LDAQGRVPLGGADDQPARPTAYVVSRATPGDVVLAVTEAIDPAGAATLDNRGRLQLTSAARRQLEGAIVLIVEYPDVGRLRLVTAERCLRALDTA
jgi:hypothetical protein